MLVRLLLFRLIFIDVSLITVAPSSSKFESDSIANQRFKLCQASRICLGERRS